MILAITFGVLAIYVFLYVATREKYRITCSDRYLDVEFNEKSVHFISSIPLPSKSSTLKDRAYKLKIKGIRVLIKMKKYLGIFDDFADDEELIKKFLKIKYETLPNTPSVQVSKNDRLEPRLVKIARFCLAHNNFLFDEKRLIEMVNEHNRHHTLTFAEIMSMKEAFLYVLLEKLCDLYIQLYTLTRVYLIAKNYCKNPNISAFDKKLKFYVKSNLFLSLCAKIDGFDSENYSRELHNRLQELYLLYASIMTSFDKIIKHDFSVYYSPLELYDKFDVFALANERCKTNFLKLAAEISDCENLDEFMFAIRVEKYMASAQSGHLKVKRFDVFGHYFCTFWQSKDISLLGLSLTSQYFFNLLFDRQKHVNNNKSIAKIIDFENTFQPIYKFQSLNFGISESGDRIKISPHLPKDVTSASIVFEHRGVYHNINIERGNERNIYVGNTRLKGVDAIKLSDKPLDIKVVVDNQ